MTQKELLYVEDIYNHEQLIINVINNLLTCCDDSTYEALLAKHLNKHTDLSNNLLNLLEEHV